VPAQDVSITAEGAVRQVRGRTYEATVGHDGCLTSLKVQGTEFFRSTDSFPRGAYLFLDGLLPCPDIQQPAPDVIEAGSEQAVMRYRFAATSQQWTVTNRTDKRLLLIIVFDLPVKAMTDDRGEWWQPPLGARCRVSTWFREGARLGISGSTRLWGPWSGDHQVWELAVGPKETREVTLEAAQATPEEAQQAAEVAAQRREPPADPVGPMWDLPALSQAPATYPAEGFAEPGVTALLYEGPVFRGKPTRVFAWLGLPEVPAGERVPGMVLVHGGGGTAFADWVRLWTERGYAALAMDTCGCVPKGEYGNWERHAFGGPWGWGGLDQADWPRQDQWTWQAVAQVLLGHSLLRSLPEVDPDRIGLTGVSWGGYLVSLVAGVDSRFRFVVPVYGCGHYLDTTFGDAVRSLGDERAARWLRWWDPSVYLPNAAMPTLWVTGTNDFAYWLPALQQSYRSPQAPHALSVTLRMSHGHGGPSEKPPVIHAFADSLLKSGAPLTRVTGQGREGSEAWVTFEANVPVQRAELLYTKATGSWPDRLWEVAPAELQAGRATATLPEGTTCYFLNLIDQRDLAVSSEHEEIKG
jgi:dienelactone hydrolase